MFKYHQFDVLKIHRWITNCLFSHFSRILLKFLRCQWTRINLRHNFETLWFHLLHLPYSSCFLNGIICPSTLSGSRNTACRRSTVSRVLKNENPKISAPNFLCHVHWVAAPKIFISTQFFALISFLGLITILQHKSIWWYLHLDIYFRKLKPMV